MGTVMEEKGAGCPRTEVVLVAMPRCRTFCREGAAELALPGAALVPARAAGVVGAEGGLQAQAAREVPRAPPRLLGLPCGRMVASGQHQAADFLVFCPQGAGCGSPPQGSGDRSGECSLRGQDLGRSSASQGPGLHALARQRLADGNAGAARQSLGCRQSCCCGRRGTGWSTAGDSPATRPRGCRTPTLRPARHSLAWHGAVCALTRQRVPQRALLALPGRSQH